MRRSLWVLSRPALTPYVLGLVFSGWVWGHWNRAIHIHAFAELFAVMLGWWALSSGTLWLNAAIDRDEGEVLLGEYVPVPDGIEAAGYAALALSVPLCLLGSPLSGAAAAVCAVLAVTYSHPAFLWKGHPVMGPVTNFVGYGLLSPLAGFGVVGVPFDVRTVIVWLLGGLGVLGCYFAAQAFQQDEDGARGYRTLVVTHGPPFTVNTARVLIGTTWTGATLLTLMGWLPLVCLSCLPLGIYVDDWLRQWAELEDGGDELWARKLASRLLSAGLLVLALSAGEYVRERTLDLPVAGLGTASGHPTSRAAAPPDATPPSLRAR